MNAHVPRQKSVLLLGKRLHIRDLVAVAQGRRQVKLDEAAWQRVRQGRAVVEEIVDEGAPAYGISTGVGSQKEFVVSPEEVGEFNRRLLTAHATRVPGPTVKREEARAALVIQANLFAKGSCGVRPELVRRLLERLTADQIPAVDASGSVGASDLVPLAQLALGVIDDSFALSSKEALSLMNSNAISLGRGALHLYDLKRLLAAFDLSAAVALEGFRGNLTSLSSPVAQASGREGQITAATRLRAILGESQLWEEEEARFLQDPLSFRCVAQIHGAGHSTLTWARQIWETELNAVTDNPLIDLQARRAISHGNMDTTSMTLAIDTLRQILAKIVTLSGERMHKQHWPAFSGLPTGLTSDQGQAIGGVQFLNLSHIAASLIASLKILAHPHLPYSIGQLSDGVEDTAGLALHSVTDLGRAIDAGWKIAALETTIGAWAIQRRGIPRDQLGVGVRLVVDALAPLLPIGREGEKEPFDIGVIVERLKEGGLLEDALAQAGLEI